jgi:hypothetical protein
VQLCSVTYSLCVALLTFQSCLLHIVRKHIGGCRINVTNSNKSYTLLCATVLCDIFSLCRGTYISKLHVTYSKKAYPELLKKCYI